MCQGRSRSLAATVLIAALATLLVVGCQSLVPTPTPQPATQSPSSNAPAKPAPTATTVDTIKIGALFDLTGSTKDVGVPYADAVRRYIQVVNSQGGIAGKQIELEEVDYGYQVPRAVDAYKKLVTQDKVVAILGWGTADTEALSPLVSQDKIPYMSASYAESLVDGTSDHPYNFLVGTTYSDQMRVLLKYVKDNWKQTDRKPSVAFVFPDNAFGRAPIATGRSVAAKLGINVVDEQILALDALDASSQMSGAQLKGADYIIINSLTPATAVAVKDAAKLGIRAHIMTLNWSADEDLIKLAGASADMLVAATPFTFLSDEKPGFSDMLAAYLSKNIDPSSLTVRNVQGWLTAKMMIEGIKRAQGKLTGEAIKAGLETIKDYDTGGITAPITWTADDHAGNKYVKLYQVNNRRWVALDDFTKVVH